MFYNISISKIPI